METLQRKEITRAKVYTKTARFPDLIYGRETSPHQDWFGVWSKSNCADLTYPLHSLPVSFRDFAVAQSKLASKLGCRLPIARFPGQHKLIEGPKRAGPPKSTALVSWATGTVSSMRVMGISRMASIMESNSIRNRSDSPCGTRSESNSQKRARVIAETSSSLERFSSAVRVTTKRIHRRTSRSPRR